MQACFGLFRCHSRTDESKLNGFGGRLDWAMVSCCQHVSLVLVELWLDAVAFVPVTLRPCQAQKGDPMLLYASTQDKLPYGILRMQLSARAFPCQPREGHVRESSLSVNANPLSWHFTVTMLRCFGGQCGRHIA